MDKKIQRNKIFEFSFMLYKNYCDIFSIVRETKKYKNILNSCGELDMFKKKNGIPYEKYIEIEKKNFAKRNRVYIIINNIITLLISLAILFFLLNLDYIINTIKENKIVFFKSSEVAEILQVYIFLICVISTYYLYRKFKKIIVGILVITITTILLFLSGTIMHRLDPNIYIGNEHIFTVDFFYVGSIVAIWTLFLVIVKLIIKKYMK